MTPLRATYVCKKYSSFATSHSICCCFGSTFIIIVFTGFILFLLYACIWALFTFAFVRLYLCRQPLKATVGGCHTAIDTILTYILMNMHLCTLPTINLIYISKIYSTVSPVIAVFVFVRILWLTGCNALETFCGEKTNEDSNEMQDNTNLRNSGKSRVWKMTAKKRKPVIHNCLYEKHKR